MTRPPMTPERWRHVKELFYSARDRPESERTAFLAEACARDAALRSEVWSLLQSHDEAEEFLEVPAALEPEGELEVEETDPMVGGTLGAYRITGVIGRGGMGAVYRGVRADDAYERQVAIKLVKRGMDTDHILHRFRAERQILARLDHPGIARLIEGGTSPDGRPYFIMEYVEGLALDRWVAEHRLDLRRRLELFLKVCDAVQYAHQSLVIHRDLKPANVLVTAEGQPKLLDFGIAKILDPQAPEQSTATALRLMTPEYASPEQVRGEPVTTATDVYALGVMLYQLLTGQRPYRLGSHRPEEVARIICEQEPERPSSAAERTDRQGGAPDDTAVVPATLRAHATRPSVRARRRRALQGDLDTIMLMALRKEPERRYPSVEQLAEDVRRHLLGFPVRARRDTLAYRAGKYLRRNRLAVAAAAAVLVTLVGGIVSTRAQRAEAEQRFQEVRRLANTVVFQIHDAIRDLPGSSKARELLIREALAYLDRLASRSRSDPALQLELATAYRKLGESQARLGATSDLGGAQGALASYRKAAALATAVVAGAPDDVEAIKVLQSCHESMGSLHKDLGQLKDALARLEDARRFGETALALNPADVALRSRLLAVAADVGMIEARTGNMAAALERLRVAEEQATALSRDPAFPTGPETLAATAHQRGWILAKAGQLDEALAALTRAVRFWEGKAAAEPLNAGYRSNLAIVHRHRGMVLGRMGRWDEALASFRGAQALSTERAAADAADFGAKWNLMFAEVEVCETLARTAERSAAPGVCRHALARIESLLELQPKSAKLLLVRSSTTLALAEALAANGALARAHDACRRGIALAREVAREHPEHINGRRYQAIGHRIAGDIFARRGDLAGARDAYRTSVELWSPVVVADPLDADSALELARAEAGRGSVQARLAARARPYQRAALWRESREAYARGVAVLEPLQARAPLQGDAAALLAAARGGAAQGPAAP